MRAELKRIHSPDVQDLEAYRSQKSFGFLIQMMIGPEGMPGEEAFDTIVCSPDWMSKHPASPDLMGDHRIVMENYDYESLYRQVQQFCQSQEGKTWQELALKLSRIGKWEFAGYAEHRVQTRP